MVADQCYDAIIVANRGTSRGTALTKSGRYRACRPNGGSAKKQAGGGVLNASGDACELLELGVQMLGTTAYALVDSGASHNFISL